jgi:tRNA(fMet)-specific endonuclease VapC
MYILDTNHCSAILRGKDPVRKKLQETDIELLTTCVIVKGELIYMGEYSERKEENLKNIYNFLNTLTIFDIDKSVAKIYGQLKSELIKKNAPSERNKKRNFRMEKISISDNDLWIASIALERSYIVLTQDSDFEKIKEVSSILKTESWIKSSNPSDLLRI